VFISADEQPKALGSQLDMRAAIAQLENALSLAYSLANAAKSAGVAASDTESQTALNKALTGLAQSGLLLHAPAGIGVVSPEAICVASGTESVGIMAAHNADISAGHDITATADGAVSVLAVDGNLQLKSAKGKVELHAASNSLHAMANNDIKIESVDGRIEISAPQELVFSCGGAFIRLKGGDIEIGAPGNIYHKAAVVQKSGATSLNAPATPIPTGYAGTYTLKDDAQQPMPFTLYQITTQEGEVFKGVTDKEGKTVRVHTLLPGGLKIDLLNEVPESGPGHWVTVDDDYQGVKNSVVMALNRLTSMGEEGKVFGSDGKDYQNTQRDKVQKWKRLPDGLEDHVVQNSAVHEYGTLRRITQTFLEGADAFAVNGSQWYWQPVTADDVYETKTGEV